MDQNLQNNPFAALFPSLEQAENFTVGSQQQQQNQDNVLRSSTRTDLPYLASKNLPPSDEDNVIGHKPSDLPTVTGAGGNLSFSDLQLAENAKNELPPVSADNAALENDFIERVFLITLNMEPSSGRPAQCVYLEDLHSSLGIQNWIDASTLEQAAFERLMLFQPKQHLVCCNAQSVGSRASSRDEDVAGEPRVMYYLYQCYCRWYSIWATKNQKAVQDDILGKCLKVITSNVQIALGHSEILPDKTIHRQALDMLADYATEDTFCRFMESTVEAVEIAHEKENEPSVLETFEPLLNLIVTDLTDVALADPKIVLYLQVMQFFATRPSLAIACIQHSTPSNSANGKSYEKTLIGSLLSGSPIPKSEQGPYEYFENASRSSHGEHEITERNLWTHLNRICSEVYHLFYTMLKLSPEVKDEVLSWIGSCLHANSERAQLWNNHMRTTVNFAYVSDGFMLNLASVLLRLCRPFSVPRSAKLALVDPTYCAASFATGDEYRSRGIHLKGMAQETCLIPLQDGAQRPQSATYKFPSDCFFMAHRSLQLGFHPLHEQITKMITELRRLQSVYSEASQGGGSPEAVENIKTAMEKGTTVYLCTKAHLMEPEMLEMMLDFHVATSTWLVNAVISNDMNTFCTFNFPLPDEVPPFVCCLPEFIVDNVSDFMAFLLKFNQRSLEMAGESLNHIMTLILVFMGDPRRMRNPHLRAKLAEALESIMPHSEDGTQPRGIISTFNREQVFRNHEHISQLATVLLHVFVSIEMTGQSVAFEQKFNYRRPMYEVLAYIWQQGVHRSAIQKLAEEAKESIEDPDPPLFLRFINLLINDAIYLLDEGLLYMSNLKDHQIRRETEEYRQLPVEQRREAEVSFRHTGMLARFHNVMGRQTINTLRFLTTDVLTIFVHPTMVDRLASMLNYFLLHLVGPKNRALKVRDMDEYEFKPQDLVSGICQIYINLGKSPEFWEAVGNDGRSYSPELFAKTEDVLFRIGQGALVPGFQEVAKKVKETTDRLKLKEDVLADAPEEFLDPIMGSVMRDPVILPSSNVIVDRSTIARHILSDQSDPFNRSPLTMDMVRPNPELKARIDEWFQKHE